MESFNNRQLAAGQIAELTNGELVGAENIIISGIATLENATENQLSFLGNKLYKQQVLNSKAAVVLVPTDFSASPTTDRAWIKCQDPSAAFSLITSQFIPPAKPPAPGIHRSAVIAESARVQSQVHIGPHVVIDEGVEVGEGSIIEAGSYVGRETNIGSRCRLFPNVTIMERSVIGNNVIIHSGSVIGSDGFGYISSSEGHAKIAQLGIVQIDDDVEIGASVTIDRARFDRTWIKKGVKIDNLVQVGHNVIIGEHSIIISQAGISGSVQIGKGAILAGQAGVAGHLKIGDGAVIMAQAGISADVESGVELMGTPAVPRKQFWRQAANLQKLPELRKRLRKLEREAAEIRDEIK
jgi:UDP-3-O-[3-hydroxymyristoyl] glucosamine N-acyltransferase